MAHQRYRMSRFSDLWQQKHNDSFLFLRMQCNAMQGNSKITPRYSCEADHSSVHDASNRVENTQLDLRIPVPLIYYR